MLVEYSDNKIEIIATFFKLESWVLCSTWDSSEAGWSGTLFCWLLSSLHKANRNVPVRGCKRVGTSLGAKPARTLVIAFLPCNTSELLASPIRRLPYKNVCAAVVWKQHFSLPYGAVSVPLRAGGQEWDSHAHSSSGSTGQPQPGKPLAWKSGSPVPLPVRGLTDTWDLSWPMEQPQMCCSLAWQCIVYLQAWPTQLGWGDALEGKECFTLSKLLPSFCKSLSLYFFPRDQRVHFAYSVISL